MSTCKQGLFFGIIFSGSQGGIGAPPPGKAGVACLDFRPCLIYIIIFKINVASHIGFGAKKEGGMYADI